MSRIGTISPLGNIIIQKRLEANLTRAQLAEECAVSENTIAKMERGEAVTREKLAPIANYFAMTIDALDSSRNDTVAPVTLKIELHIDSFNAPELAAHLLNFLKAATGVERSWTFRKGSVVFSIDLLPDELDRLCAAFHQGHLTRFNISAICLYKQSYDPGIDAELQSVKERLATFFPAIGKDKRIG